jgi:hypothetical protein
MRFRMNGNGQDQPQAPPTSSLWGDVFGISGLVKALSDPAMMQGAQAMMTALAEGGQASRRIEAKLDMLLRALGHEIETINARFPAHFGGPAGPGGPFDPRIIGGQSAPLLEGDRADGGRGSAIASLALDNGGRGAADRVDPARGDPRNRGDFDSSGNLR